MTEIICAGFGGQGVLTAGVILAKIAVDAGKQVSWLPSYGSEMRGGTANCAVKISDSEIGSPYVKKPDVVIAMNEPSVDKFESLIKAGGVLIVNTSIVGRKEYRQDIEVIQIPATEIAVELANPRGANIAMLGALIAKTTLMSKEAFVKGLDDFFSSKGKANPLNIKCFEKSYELAKEQSDGGCCSSCCRT